MNDKTQSPAAAVSARRRLVSRAFAAPAVLTLLSGSAFAVTSNLRCIANKVGGTPSYPGVGPADTWLRVQQYLVGAVPWVRGLDVVALKGSNPVITTYLSSGQFQQVTSPFTIQSASPGALSVDVGKWVAVRVDINGNIVGIVGTGNGATSAIAQTCWASFRVAPSV